MLKRFTHLATQLGAQRHLVALRHGILLGMPLIMIGSMFIFLNSFPNDSYLNVLTEYGLRPYLAKAANGSFGLMGLIASFGIASSLAETYDLDGKSVGIVALSCFVIVTPSLFSGKESGIPFAYTGSTGLFVAILVAFSVAEVFRLCVQYHWEVRMPETVPEAVGRSFSALIPGFISILFWWGVYILIDHSPYDHIHMLIAQTLAKPLSVFGSSLLGTVLMIGVNSLFWFVGVHGSDTVNPIFQPVWLANTEANRLALDAGQAIPQLITYEFMMNFVWIGGGGATIGLAFLLAGWVKSERYRTLGRFSLIASIFNINEPLTFGIPIVLNTRLLIPFVLAPTVNATVSYTAMSLGWVHPPSGVSVPWATPAILSGYMATGGHLSGAILQMILILLSVAIYYPFMMALDRDELRIELSAQGNHDG